jgi:ribosomal silencing factor RsfS
MTDRHRRASLLKMVLQKVVEELKSESEKSSHRGRNDRRQWTAIDVFAEIDIHVFTLQNLRAIYEEGGKALTIPRNYFIKY